MDRRGRDPGPAPRTGLATAGAERHRDAAVDWFRQAERLHPDNGTYKRQSWSFADPLQGPTDLYDSDWLSDIQAIGAENYYPTIDW